MINFGLNIPFALIFCLFLVGALLDPLEEGAEAQEQRRTVLVYQSGGVDLVSIAVEGEDLEEVLQEISSQLPVPFIARGLGKRRVTAQFSGLPLYEALKRLMGSNYLIIETSGAIQTVVFLNESDPLQEEEPLNLQEGAAKKEDDKEEQRPDDEIESEGQTVEPSEELPPFAPMQENQLPLVLVEPLD